MMTAFACTSTVRPFTVDLSLSAAPLSPLEVRVVGRVVEWPGRDGAAMFERQWPGTYIEGAFRGRRAFFDVESEGLSLSVTVDDKAVQKIIDVEPGRYAVSGLRDEEHIIRVQVVSENQSRASVFGGLYIDRDGTPLTLPARKTQFEFIGDSHTVGYANTSDTRECSNEEVSVTTDTSLGLAGQLSTIYDADYQVNAISGRGVVRNYDGGKGVTIPKQYPYALLSSSNLATLEGWAPDIIIISIGTNDFSTELKLGEPWASREALIKAYEAEYFAFIESLMARDTESYVLVWVAADETAEKYKAAASVVDRIKAQVGNQIAFIPVEGLGFEACHWHPTVKDATIITETLAAYIERYDLLAH